MNHITFPGIGLEFQISKVAFSFLGIDIYWYSVFIVCAIVVALFLCMTSKDNYGIKFEEVIDVAIVTIIFGIIGARLYFVMFNLKYYLADPIRIISLRDGGLGIYGGLILGGLALVFRAKKLELNPYDFLDYIVPFVAIAQSIGRLGNFFNIEAYGEKTDSFLRMGINSIEGYIEVHPTFLYEAVSTFVIFCIIRILQKKRRFKGQIFLLYLMLYSFIRFFIEGLRADSLMIGEFRVSQILSAIIFIISLYSYIKKQKD